MARADLLDLRDDVYRRPLLTALTRIDVQEGWRVADIGAGNGDVSVALAKLVGEDGRVYSVDIDPLRRNDVASRAAEHAQVIAITQAVEELGLPEEVDLTFCRFLLLGVHDPVVAVSKMVESVRPGGWVVFQEPVTTAGRVGHTPLQGDPDVFSHQDVGIDLPLLLAKTDAVLVDCWAEAPVGLGSSAIGKYLAEMSGIGDDHAIVMLPPLVTAVAQRPH